MLEQTKGGKTSIRMVGEKQTFVEDGPAVTDATLLNSANTEEFRDFITD